MQLMQLTIDTHLSLDVVDSWMLSSDAPVWVAMLIVDGSLNTEKEYWGQFLIEGCSS